MVLQIVSEGYKFKLRALLLVPELRKICFTVLVVAKEINQLAKKYSLKILQNLLGKLHLCIATYFNHIKSWLKQATKLLIHDGKY